MFSETQIREDMWRQTRLAIADRWRHKAEGTAQTHEYASRRRNPLLALFIAGQIDREQLAAAEEIAEVHRWIERDVAASVVSYEPRVDRSHSGSAGSSLRHVETVRMVRREVAYSWWRSRIAPPQGAVLEMIVGEASAFSTVARRYAMHKRKARRMLIDGLDLWKDALCEAEMVVDEASLAAVQSGLI